MSGVNTFPDGCAPTLLGGGTGMLANPAAPEELAPPKIGDPQTWVAGPGGSHGNQPKTAGNPNGDYYGRPLAG